MVRSKVSVRLGIRKLVSVPLFLIACVVLLGLQPVSSSAQSDGDEEALLALATQTWKGDLAKMRSRGFVRVLTVFNPLFFYYDGGDEKGIGKGHTYYSFKNKKGVERKLELKKYNPIARKRTLYKESKK